MSTLLEQVAIPQNQPTPKRHLRAICIDCKKRCSQSAKRCFTCLLAKSRIPVSEAVIFIDNEPCRLIALTRGQSAIVDASDFETLSTTAWHAWRSSKGEGWYPSRSIRKGSDRSRILMHRVLLNPPKGLEVDHRNGNTLDNRRSNLRLATRSQQGVNTRIPRDNTSGVKGVSWDKSRKLWHSYIAVNHVRTTLGFFEKLEDAANARRIKESELFGEWSRGT